VRSVYHRTSAHVTGSHENQASIALTLAGIFTVLTRDGLILWHGAKGGQDVLLAAWRKNVLKRGIIFALFQVNDAPGVSLMQRSEFFF
jgi:hypothetical protein